jgi:hypothetical protein
MKSISNDIESRPEPEVDALAVPTEEALASNRPDGFACSSCCKQKKADSFHKNASRKSGYEHRCKTCVSSTKAAQYKSAKKFVKNRNRFRSVLVGHLTDETIRDFAQSLSSVIKEWCSDDNCA